MQVGISKSRFLSGIAVPWLAFIVRIVIAAAYPLARKILFSLDAEVAHRTSMAGLRFAEKTGLLNHLRLGRLGAEENVPFYFLQLQRLHSFLKLRSHG